MRSAGDGRKAFGEGRTVIERNYSLESPTCISLQIDNKWYEPYCADTWHCHNTLEVGFCCEGEGLLGMGTKQYSFSKGSVAVVPRGVMHVQMNRGKPSTHWRYLVFNDDYLMSSLRCTGNNLKFICRFLERIRTTGTLIDLNERTEVVLGIVRELFDCCDKEEGQAAILEAGGYLILSMLACAESSSAMVTDPEEEMRLTPVEPALRLIDEQFNRDIRVDELASSCRMSESYFRKTFSTLLGTSPLEYLNRYRIQRVINLMRTTDESIITLAMSCGFSSIATFNRNFKHFMGKSPSVWWHEKIRKNRG